MDKHSHSFAPAPDLTAHTGQTNLGRQNASEATRIGLIWFDSLGFFPTAKARLAVKEPTAHKIPAHSGACPSLRSLRSFAAFLHPIRFGLIRPDSLGFGPIRPPFRSSITRVPRLQDAGGPWQASRFPLSADLVGLAWIHPDQPDAPEGLEAPSILRRVSSDSSFPLSGLPPIRLDSLGFTMIRSWLSLIRFSAFTLIRFDPAPALALAEPKILGSFVPLCNTPPPSAFRRGKRDDAGSTGSTPRACRRAGGPAVAGEIAKPALRSRPDSS